MKAEADAGRTIDLRLQGTYYMGPRIVDLTTPWVPDSLTPATNAVDGTGRYRLGGHVKDENKHRRHRTLSLIEIPILYMLHMSSEKLGTQMGPILCRSRKFCDPTFTRTLWTLNSDSLLSVVTHDCGIRFGQIHVEAVSPADANVWSHIYMKRILAQ
jgi:hypothetical protein